MESLSKQYKSKRRGNAISLTPLIDVVFILLVFFMLASSFEKHRSIELSAPIKGKAATLNRQQTPVTVLVEGKDRYSVEGKTYTLDDINEFLDLNREKTILIKSGPKASLQDVVYVLDLGASLSLGKISLLPFEGKPQ